MKTTPPRNIKLDSRRLPSLSKTIFYAVFFFALIWSYFWPIDYFQPAVRSARRPKPIAQSQAEDAQVIDAEVRALLAKFNTLAKEKFPNDYVDDFAPPATEEEIEELEYWVGCALPEDFKAYLRTHNGHNNRWGKGSFYGYQPLLPCKEILKDSIDLLAIGRDFPTVPLEYAGCWFHPGVIIFEERDGGGYCLQALTGEIMSWDHDGGPLKVIAPKLQGSASRHGERFGSRL